jgi:iron complex outermembrane receptor protein
VAVTNENIDHSYQGYLSFLSRDSIMREGGDFGPIRTAVTDIQHNLKGDFKLAGLRNRFVWGVDYVSYYQKRNSKGTTILDTIDITKPIDAITEMDMDYAYAHVTGTGYNSEYKYQQLASYVSDVVNLTGNLMVLASIRFDRYMLDGDYGYNQNSWTPRFGLVYQPVKEHISLFGNYMSGFTNNGIGTQPDGSPFVFKPSFARQWEGGVKVNAWQNRITGSISYYSINIDDAPRTDPDGYLHQDGEQKSKGIDVDLRIAPAKGLSVTAGYGYNRNKYIKSDYNEGKLVGGSPENVANAWVSYRFSGNPVLQHFGIGAGVNYASDAYLDDANTMVIPAYTYVNGTLFYESNSWRLGVALNNISGERYWNAYATPQTPRNVTANVTFKF